MPQKLGITPEQREEIAACYQSGKSLAQTAKQFNISSRSVRYTLEMLGIATRGVAEGYAALWKDPDYKENQRQKKLGKPSGATGKTWKVENPPKRKRGEEASGWKGGLTPLGTLIRTSVEYLMWKKEILKRDEYGCVLCSNNYYKDKSVILDVDHIVPFTQILREQQVKTMEQARICKELWDIDNGRVLCRECHKKTESYGGKTRPVEYRPRRKNNSPKR